MRERLPGKTPKENACKDLAASFTSKDEKEPSRHQARETAQTIKCLLCKHEDLTLSHKVHSKSQVLWYKLIISELEEGGDTLIARTQ